MVFRILRRYPERFVKSGAGVAHAQVRIQHQQWFARSRQDAVGERMSTLDDVHIDQHHDDAVDLVVQGTIRAQAQ